MPTQKAAKVTLTSDIKVEAPKPAEGYTRVRSPLGAESIVPDSVLEALIDSGYTEL